mmetsp:Transcript_29228/g.68205  ORF Transcript_29228/g.68205 Transcript_29228/m.68205 type:complete len:128 (+) Transcript_29228:149-532(+)
MANWRNQNVQEENCPKESLVCVCLCVKKRVESDEKKERPPAERAGFVKTGPSAKAQAVRATKTKGGGASARVLRAEVGMRWVLTLSLVTRREETASKNKRSSAFNLLVVRSLVLTGVVAATLTGGAK